MIVTQNGFDHQKLSPELARLFGDGSGLLVEASLTNCSQIEPLHFLAYWAKTAGTILRVEFLEARRVEPESFCTTLYEVGLDEARTPGLPLLFGSESFSPSAQKMLEAFEHEIVRRGLQYGDEALFVCVLFRHLDPIIGAALAALIGSEEALNRFLQILERRILAPTPTSIFDPKTGDLLYAAFDKSGRRVLDRLSEETAALGYKKATILHLLYALVGIDNGILQHALQTQVIDPLREIHGYLSRELTRPGAKRVLDFKLSRDTLHSAVLQTLAERASAEAHKEGVPISELHIVRALFTSPNPLITATLKSRKVSLEGLQEYLAHVESEPEESVQRTLAPVNQIEAELKQKILGQDHAIRRVLPLLKRLRFGFPRDRGPAAVFLFLGPSGTGKTQLAKELARIIYGSEEQLILLEMGQFNTKESSNIFIGAPPGYVGYGEGRLTNGLRDKPESVVLFDEIEKAHEDVWVALLRFLDEGLINDPAGPTRDGRRCTIVLTSNLGADQFAERIAPGAVETPETDKELEQSIRAVVLPYLKRPEIYNRVDDKVVFRPFDLPTYRALIERQVALEKHKFLNLFHIQITLQPGVIDWLTEQATAARLEGARAVPRVVNRYVVSPIIDLLTTNEEQVIQNVIVSKRSYDAGVVAEAR